MKKYLKYFLNTILCGLLVFVGIYLPKINAVNSTFNKEFVYIENSDKIDFKELRSQIDKSVPSTIFTKDSEADRLNPLKSTYVVVFNSYLFDNFNVVRFGYVYVTRENIFSLNWKVEGIKLGFVVEKTFAESVNLLENTNLESNSNLGNIRIMSDFIPTHNIKLGQEKHYDENTLEVSRNFKDELMPYINKSVRVESNSEKFILFAPYYDKVASQYNLGNSKQLSKEYGLYYGMFYIQTATSLVLNQDTVFKQDELKIIRQDTIYRYKQAKNIQERLEIAKQMENYYVNKNDEYRFLYNIDFEAFQEGYDMCPEKYSPEVGCVVIKE